MLEGTAAGLAVQEKVPFNRNDFLEKVGAIGSKDRNKDTLLEAIINEVDRSTTNRVVRRELEIQGKEDKLLQELADGKSEDLLAKPLDREFDNLVIQLQAELGVDKAILGKKLEPFVDLFLDREFVLHRYLKSDKLVSLFNEAKDREFLTTTSLEGILGLTGVMHKSII